MLQKRIFDIVFAMLGIIFLSPLFILIAISIKLTSSGPVFFRQQRVGQYTKIFWIHKFRTMINNSEQLGPKITVSGDKRITLIGRLLRKTKLDELPQLIDVILGDMSLVGPRPEVPEYVAYYPLEVKDIIFSVKPGITDWASIYMIDESNILATAMDPKKLYIETVLPQKLEFAVKYVNSYSLSQDIKIIVTTILKIIRR